MTAVPTTKANLTTGAYGLPKEMRSEPEGEQQAADGQGGERPRHWNDHDAPDRRCGRRQGGARLEPEG
jgi:hypothetical protein